MKFAELNNLIPYVTGGEDKILKYSPYPNVTIAMPGRHADQTIPEGGDFVVMITDPVFNLVEHQFTHIDIFKDVQSRIFSSAYKSEDFMTFYLRVIKDGISPTDNPFPTSGVSSVINNDTFFAAVQCLAIAEHRRYAKYESKFGGRYLPFRFASGIAQGLWTAADAAGMQKRGRPGVEILERQYGRPKLTEELMT